MNQAFIVEFGDSHGLARDVTTNSYKNRTTLWDDQAPTDSSASQPIRQRGAWRAPSSILAPDISRPAAGDTPVASVRSSIQDEDDRPAPRRTNFYASRRPWWRPRTILGRVLLGAGITAVVFVLIAAGVITRNFAIRDAHFRIPGASGIQSTGLSEVNRAEVLPVFGADIGRNIFFVPLEERRKQLEEIAWVKQATVMRFLPDRLTVSIIERTPVAFVRQGNAIELADADGVILSMSPALMAQHHYSFPVVSGIDSKDSVAARRARMAVYLRFVTEVDQNQQHLAQQVSEIDLSDPEDLRATMPEQGSDILAHFGEDHFLHRLEVYHAHIAEWRQRYPKLIGVDLRYNGEVPLEMASETSASDGAKAAPIKISAIGGTTKSYKVPKTIFPKPISRKLISPAAKAASAKSATGKTARLKAGKAQASKAQAAHERPAQGQIQKGKVQPGMPSTHPVAHSTNIQASPISRGQ